MILKAEHLIKKYKSRTVVKDVSVQVEQGEIVGLLGPNGAGKTTSFYMIVGLITPNGGRIFLDDQEITKEPVYKRAQTGVEAEWDPDNEADARKIICFGVPAAECRRQYPRCIGNDQNDQRRAERPARRNARRIRVAAYP